VLCSSRAVVPARSPTAVRLDDPEALIIVGLGLALLLVALLGPLLFGLPGWSRLGAVLGLGFLLYGVAGLRRS
jgi:hypothetical protein